MAINPFDGFYSQEMAELSRRHVAALAEKARLDEEHELAWAAYQAALKLPLDSRNQEALNATSHQLKLVRARMDEADKDIWAILREITRKAREVRSLFHERFINEGSATPS